MELSGSPIYLTILIDSRTKTQNKTKFNAQIRE